jgi:hypothetical protein
MPARHRNACSAVRGLVCAAPALISLLVACHPTWDVAPGEGGATPPMAQPAAGAPASVAAGDATAVEGAAPPSDANPAAPPVDPAAPGDQAPAPAGPQRPIESHPGGVDSTEIFPDLAKLQVFPDDNPWNQDISAFPLHPLSAAYIASIGPTKGLHPDFGTVWEGGPIGIPFVVVPADQPKVPVAFYYASESDPGPYPIPPDAPIEGGPDSSGDRHILVVDYFHKRLYEVFDAWRNGAGGWQSGSGAIFDLTSNELRPDCWTSADAAGLPIFPGLVRYDEVVERGEIRHALRFTVSKTQKAFIHPATHYASSSTDPNRPPMGLRLRLKAGFDVTPYHPHVQVILKALKKYGMIVADNGSDWYISGTHDLRWNDQVLSQLKQIKGSQFEVVYTGVLVTQCD